MNSISYSVTDNGSCSRSNMAAQTGSTHVSGTMTDSVEIPTANLGFSIVTSKQKVPRDECVDDRQPEVAIWPPNRKYSYLWNYDR